MRLGQNSHNKLLSLFLDVARCSFVKLVAQNGEQSTRYQMGNAEQSGADFVGARNQDVSEYFVQGSIIELGKHQLRFSLVNELHIHFEYMPADESRKKLNKIHSINKHVTIDLFHEQKLPGYLLTLEQHCASNIDLWEEQHVQESDNKQAARTFLKTMLVTLEGLQFIEHYIDLTRDSLTKLQSRTSLQREIDEQINNASIALCLIHCTDFQSVNRKFGQVKGDEVLSEITQIINQYTHQNDIVGRFGGALFGIAIHASSLDDGHKLAYKLQKALHAKHYLQNAIRLTFDMGIAFISEQEAGMDNSSTSSLLLNRAEQALKAAQNSSAPSIAQWEPDKFKLDEQEFNYLGGIFTPDNVTNYRNMMLLWDISSIIADEHSFARLLRSVIERLSYTFEFTYAGVITTDEDKPQNYAFMPHDNTEIKEIDLDDCDDKFQLMEAAHTAIEKSQHTEHEENNNNALIIPLGTATKECFFILGAVGVLDLTHDSVMLFVGFARQIGKALKRSQLEDELNQKLEQQNTELEQELLELKAGMQSSALVYRSQKMQKIVEQTQRAAQTDTTVLLTGESGTGKEKLIHAIHTLSNRSDKPLVIMDCGSIPESLIESELFGHVKGAFTGLQSESQGKIQAANGGILVLDEIGELPMSMQPKLLRFVQEKRYTPVGSNKAVKVDVKIVAVTNRDLSYEVAQGKFRKDLFYRLNVVSLHKPPLRERVEDIEVLSQHFLSKFYRQFETSKKFLSEDTINLMKAYDWPGNIRELENKLMQACLLTANNEITFDDLQLDIMQQKHLETKPITVDSAVVRAQPLGAHTRVSCAALQNSPLNNLSEYKVGNDTHSHANWDQKFSSSIHNLLGEMSEQAKNTISIGTAIEAKLLQMAHTKAGSHSQTALLLAIPVSTARRRLQKKQPDTNSLITLHAWQNINNLLALLVDGRASLSNPLETVKTIIAAQILKQYGANMTLASQLMGVSEPTMYKLRKALS